jgi:enoyl-CoA hydratase
MVISQVLIENLIAPPITGSVLQAGCFAHPVAAQTLLDLLPAIGDCSADKALTMESLTYARLQGSPDHRRWLDERPPVASLPEGRLNLSRTGPDLAITIDRPFARNAIDRGMRDALYEALTLASLDPDIRNVVLNATGKAFSIGGDLSEFGTTRDPEKAHEIRMRTLPARAILGCAEKMHVHVHGACVGAGLEIAAFAARVTAGPKAWFQLPELSMGLIPGAGGCVSVPRRIGWQRTAAMILSGQRINAQTALQWGLVDELLED